jgi:hypothetical protein
MEPSQRRSPIMHSENDWGVYGRCTGYLVTVVGTMTFIGTFRIVVRPLSFFTLFGLMLTAIWQIVVGVKLHRLGRYSPLAGLTQG